MTCFYNSSASKNKASRSALRTREADPAVRGGGVTPSRCPFIRPKRKFAITGRQTAAGCETMDGEAQAKALRLRMYVLCSKCARLIDLAEGNRPQLDVQ